jgi:hypothetical protein
MRRWDSHNQCYLIHIDIPTIQFIATQHNSTGLASRSEYNLLQHNTTGLASRGDCLTKRLPKIVAGHAQTSSESMIDYAAPTRSDPIVLDTSPKGWIWGWEDSTPEDNDPSVGDGTFGLEVWRIEE